MFVIALSTTKDPTAMKNNATGSLDRRDFVIASLATVGASAAFAATAAAADAQDKAASPPPTGTTYTGDLIGGKKVISALEVKDLDPGRKHAFYFQGVQMPTGQHWYVSVMVAKGAKPGTSVIAVPEHACTRKAMFMISLCSPISPLNPSLYTLSRVCVSSFGENRTAKGGPEKVAWNRLWGSPNCAL
jgi:hypothetical protein